MAIRKKDWNSIETFIQDEWKARESNEYRQKHEKRWKVVDRQVYMEEMARIPKGELSKADDWRSAIELGELSRASEILSADIRRLLFPQNRTWFEAHANGQNIGAEGIETPPPEVQARVDGTIRAFLTQQHMDFGFKSRVDLSVKETLHHGGFVATIDWESWVTVEEGMRVKPVNGPVWTPYSMWNAYPDCSMSMLGNNPFYQGSMILRSWMKPHDFKALKGREHWFNIDKIDMKGEKEDIEILTYYGDLAIPRVGKDVLLPNCQVKLANNTVVYYRANPLPFPEVIYFGWERLDVRDPYYISPLVKLSPTQVLATTMANKFVDAVERMVDPPVEYDGSDPDYVRSGGPDTAPGSKNPTRGQANFRVLDIGDPNPALNAVQFFSQQLEEGTSVDSIRAGVAAGTEQTATEVVKRQQSGEIRTIDFVDKFEQHGLYPALYLMYELNKKNLKTYSFYNPEVNAPDFETIKGAKLPKEVRFEIVGSKGVLGEEQRQLRTMQWTQFLLSNPLTAQIPNTELIAVEGYRDAGNKNAERFVTPNAEKQALQQQIQEITQQAQAQVAQLTQENEQLKIEAQLKDAEHRAEKEQLELEKEQRDTENKRLSAVNSGQATMLNLERQRNAIQRRPV